MFAAIPIVAIGTSKVSAQTPAAPNPQPVVLPEISVTGTKLPRDLQRVDGTVAVTEPAELARRNIISVDGLDRIIPDLTIRPRAGRIYSGITLRGQNSADFYNPSVQVLIDGLPQDFALLGQLLPQQVERIEVLYGPQGTLYGAGAVGGVINIVTRRPDDRLRTGGLGYYSNRQRGGGAYLNVPLVPGALFGDVSVNYRDQPGYYRPPVGNEEFGATRDIGGQARLRLAPRGSPWDVMVAAAHNVVNSAEEQYVFGRTGFDTRRTARQDSHYRLRIDSFGLIASYDFGSAVAASLTGYQDRELERTVFGNRTEETQRTLSHELRIASVPGQLRHIDYVAGLFFQRGDFSRDVPRARQRSDQTITTFAAFGEMIWHITPRLDLTAGLRVDHIQTEATATGVVINFNRQRDDTALSPKLSLGYQIAEGLRAFALYSSGFRPGGFTRTVTSFNASFDYGTSRTDNFEIGLRARMFDGRFNLSLSGYYSLTHDYQTFVGPVRFQYLQNSGDVRSYGINALFSAEPVDNLRLSGGIALNNARFINYQDPTRTGQDYNGNRPTYAPPITANLSVSYGIDLPGTLGQVVPNAAVNYVGRTWFDEANTVGQGAYALFDAGVAWVPNDRLRTDLYVQNIGDKRYATYGFLFSPFVGKAFQLGNGREVGLRVTANF